ncbi:MAG: alpha/beta fold hydrolase [Gemmatimonadaceae bacterium]|nr:alpha/beta fold hydrolase [Gemmatimonadaceae bacterium]
MLFTFAGACGGTAPPTVGLWIGDAKRVDGADRIEMTVDSSGTTARITLAAWQVDTVTASRVTATGDSLVFIAVVQKDTMRLTGAHANGKWHGDVSLGERRAAVEMVRLFVLGDAEQRAMAGTYRTAIGRDIGIAPFSEFGARLMVIDYESGRIGPLYPVSRHQLIVGRSIISPTFPADSLTLIRSGTGAAERIRFAERGLPVVVAARLGTRDEEVQFSSGSVRLAGTHVLPPGPPPYPAIVLVHGSNAQTRDALGPWSRFFVAQGFAVLSYDKRGTGTSTGDWKSADFDSLAGDVIAGVRFLTGRADIKPDRVGLWGISQAGWILPIVAATAAPDIAFLVVHAGSGTTVREEGVLYLQAELRAAGLPSSSVDVGTRYQQLDDIVTATGNGWQELQRYYEAHRTTEPWLWPPRAADDWFRTYFRMLIDFDPTSYWRRVRCPVLLFFGEFDVNVPPAESWPPIERALRDGGNARATKVLLPKANHVFLEAKTGGRDEYPGLSRFVPGYFNRMAEWLRATAR